MEIEINVAAPQDTQCMVLSVSQAQLDQLDLRDLLDLPVRQSRVFMHNIRFSFVLSRQAVRLPCSQSLG